jgi:hypothetical protein
MKTVLQSDSSKYVLTYWVNSTIEKGDDIESNTEWDPYSGASILNYKNLILKRAGLAKTLGDIKMKKNYKASIISKAQKGSTEEGKLAQAFTKVGTNVKEQISEMFKKILLTPESKRPKEISNEVLSQTLKNISDYVLHVNQYQSTIGFYEKYMKSLRKNPEDILRTLGGSDIDSEIASLIRAWKIALGRLNKQDFKSFETNLGTDKNYFLRLFHITNKEELENARKGYVDAVKAFDLILENLENLKTRIARIQKIAKYSETPEAQQGLEESRKENAKPEQHWDDRQRDSDAYKPEYSQQEYNAKQEKLLSPKEMAASYANRIRVAAIKRAQANPEFNLENLRPSSISKKFDENMSGGKRRDYDESSFIGLINEAIERANQEEAAGIPLNPAKRELKKSLESFIHKNPSMDVKASVSRKAQALQVPQPGMEVIQHTRAIDRDGEDYDLGEESIGTVQSFDPQNGITLEDGEVITAEFEVYDNAVHVENEVGEEALMDSSAGRAEDMNDFEN